MANDNSSNNSSPSLNSVAVPEVVTVPAKRLNGKPLKEKDMDSFLLEAHEKIVKSEIKLRNKKKKNQRKSANQDITPKPVYVAETNNDDNLDEPMDYSISEKSELFSNFVNKIHNFHDQNIDKFIENNQLDCDLSSKKNLPEDDNFTVSFEQVVKCDLMQQLSVPSANYVISKAITGDKEIDPESLPKDEVNIPSKPIAKKTVSNKTRILIPRTNPNKMECFYQYAIEYSLDPEKFLIVTEADKKRWAGRLGSSLKLRFLTFKEDEFRDANRLFDEKSGTPSGKYENNSARSIKSTGSTGSKIAPINCEYNILERDFETKRNGCEIYDGCADSLSYENKETEPF
ncbi:hypothetical protein C1646_676543 [Rhizophagus diaphanus]|nr:hypothetical protein C1646_676543 [Rhizophagus diaphanus] [Rhizophagus sp. MUCL 43196]